MLRSRYKNFNFGSYIGYAAAILIVFSLVYVVASVAKNLPRRITPQHLELVVFDDTDPQIQAILLETVEKKPRQTPEDILKNWTSLNDSREGICGVCYEPLDKELLECPKCNKASHNQCLKDWLESGQSNCIYCRHDFMDIKPSQRDL